MVQILQPQARERRPTFGQKLNEGLGRGLQLGSEMLQAKTQKDQMHLENEAARSFGVDLTGIHDPKLRQEALSMALQGQNQQQLEMLKQRGKEGLFNKKQGFLEQLFSGNQEQSQNQQQTSKQENDQSQNFNPSNISDADIARAASIDPVLGRELRAAKDTALREKRSERDFLERQKEKSPEFQRENQIASGQATADVKYNQTLQEASKQHELKEQSLDRLEKLNKKGVTGKPYEKILEKVGLINLTSEGRREFAADVKNLITDIRSILGAQFTGFEFQTILNAYPSADFSKEANSAIIHNLKDFQDIKKKEVEFANQLKKENDGKIPYDFQAQVNEKVRDYAASKLGDIKKNTREIMNEQYGVPKGHTLLLDPYGEPLSVPDDEVEQLLQNGAELP